MDAIIIYLFIIILLSFLANKLVNFIDNYFDKNRYKMKFDDADSEDE